MYKTSKINPICFSFSFGRSSNKIWLLGGVSIHSYNIFHSVASQWRHMTIWLFGYGMPPWHPSIKSTEWHAFLVLPGMQCAVCQKTLLPLPYCVLSDSFLLYCFLPQAINYSRIFLYLDWPQALSKCFCSFNSAPNMGSLCSSKVLCMKSPMGNISEHSETWKTLPLSRDILELHAADIFTSMSQSATLICHAGSWRQLEIGVLWWSSILVVLVISRCWPS